MENKTGNSPYTDEYTRFIRFFRYIQNERSITLQDFVFDWKILLYNGMILFLYYKGAFDFAGNLKDLLAIILSIGVTLWLYKKTKRRFYDKERIILKKYINKIMRLIGSI